MDTVNLSEQVTNLNLTDLIARNHNGYSKIHQSGMAVIRAWSSILLRLFRADAVTGLTALPAMNC